jgi:hypothetical protein
MCYNFSVRRAPIAHLMAFVLAYDTQAMMRGKKTITAEFRDSFTEAPVITAAGTLYILAHLFNYPKHFQRVDAFNGYALLFGYINKRLVKSGRELD